MRAFWTALVAILAIAHPEASFTALAGRVTFNGDPVPGATVEASSGDRTSATATDTNGHFTCANLADGTWTIRVVMRGFVTASRDVTLPRAADAAPLEIALTMQPLAEIVAESPHTSPAASVNAPTPTADAEPIDIITGSVVNGATTPFAQPRAFGNNRPRQGALYNFAAFAAGGDSAWNARPYSFIDTPASRPLYGDLQLGGNLAGPLRIPWVLRYGPQVQLSYQHGLVHNATTQSALVPTFDERRGDFANSGSIVRDPLTGAPFAGNAIPASRISPQAAALLAYFPPPTPSGVEHANFQRAVLSSTTSDQMQFSLTKRWSPRTSMTGSVAWQHAASDSTNLFAFVDDSTRSSLNGNLDWSRQYSSRLTVHVRYQFTGSIASVTPFFAGRTNVSGDAGIAGNAQDPSNWGPPTLVFPDVASLSDGQAQRAVNMAHATGAEAQIRRGSHNITLGGDYRWNVADVRAQPNPRGTLTFTGAASGNAFADFLLGVPAASAIAAGGPAHLRGIAPDAYANDDWRALATVTLNLGLRWEYDSPFTESSGHLANLDVAPGFTAVAPVLATDPTGPLTGLRYPASLVHPDRRGFEPRLGASWRPSLASSLVFKGSYGLYRNLGGYQSLALLLAQQPPFARSFNLQSTSATPLTLAQPFPTLSDAASNTFAIDPGFRVSLAHTWQASMQRELPASLTVLVAYLGARGTHLTQASLPNTNAPGSTTATSGPSGFIDVSSNGTSLRNALQITLRRRLYAGFTASAQYTLAKSTDDAATFANGAITPGSLSIAQDWRALAAERGPSSFDQRHHLDLQAQYTTGVGLKGGTLVDGFWGSAWKDWTVAADLSGGSGMPFTPVAFVSIAGSGVVGVRPSLTGLSTAPVSSHSYANPAAFAAPPPGEWGNAGRNSLRGPAQFSLNMSLARVFRVGSRLNFEWRIAATNVLNRVTFASVNAVVGSPQFGFATVANPMRALQMTVRLRF